MNRKRGSSIPAGRIEKEEKVKKIVTIFVCIGALLISFNVNAKGKMPKSGFLGDYSGFKPGPSGGANWVYFKKGVEFGKYKKVTFDQVTFYLKEDAKDRASSRKISGS